MIENIEADLLNEKILEFIKGKSTVTLVKGAGTVQKEANL
jgi:hypothetical protein